jgi:hypothetical protein
LTEFDDGLGQFLYGPEPPPDDRNPEPGREELEKCEA